MRLRQAPKCLAKVSKVSDRETLAPPIFTIGARKCPGVLRETLAGMGILDKGGKNHKTFPLRAISWIFGKNSVLMRLLGLKRAGNRE